MENIKENYNEIIRLKNINYKLGAKNDELQNDISNLYNNNYDEYKRREEETKKNNEKIQLNSVKIAILKANLHYLFKIDFDGIKDEIISIYNTKNIGEKTAEKIQDKIKAYFKNNYNVDNLACYVSKSGNYCGPAGLDIKFDFLNNDGFKSYILEYREGFTIEFKNYSYNDYKLTISYYNDIKNYIPVKEITKEAKRLIKEYNKAQAKIKKLYDEQRAIYHAFNDNLDAFTSEKLKLEEKLLLYYR